MRNEISAVCSSAAQSLRELWANPPSPSTPQGRRTIIGLRVAILASSVLLMLPGAWGHSVTVVEFVHLPAGLAAWQRHSLGIYRVCAPLSKFLYALPAHLAGVRVDYPESIDSDVQARRERGLGVLFQRQNCKRYHDIYRWSRLLPILVTILGGCLVCEWSTRLFGAWPGFVSLCLWCWMPPILAHGSLATSDMLSAVILLLAARCFWGFLLKPNLATTVLAGVALGLALATKFTLLILYPSWILLLIGRAIQLRGIAMVESREPRASPARLVTLALIILTISLVVLDAIYLFQDIGFRLEQLEPAQSALAQGVHRLKGCRVTEWLTRFPLPVPLEFLRGLDFQLADTELVQTAYLLGQKRVGGWWYWYAVASLIKIPLPALALFSLATFRLPAAFSDSDSLLCAGFCLLVPAAEVGLVISATTGTGTNAAFRYLIPILASLCVWVGAVGRHGSVAIWVATIALLGSLAVNSVVATPDHLGWQNELGWIWSRWSGRPALVGDSLDWGQDMARLGEWVSRHSGEGSTLVGVYGSGEAEPYGLTWPNARPVSGGWSRSTYIGVSEGVLFDDSISNYVSIAGWGSHLSQAQRKALLLIHPFDRIGRTIRIYRLSDLIPTGRFPESDAREGSDSEPHEDERRASPEAGADR